MKKRGSLILSVLMIFMLVACDNQAGSVESPTAENQKDISVTEKVQTKAPDNSETPASEGNILIAYFSSAGNIATDESAKGNIGNGNTKFLAELIQEQVGGNLFFIETVDKYPANYNETIDVAMQEQRDNARPALATHVENMDNYDAIFLGFPNWWGTLPQAVFTFLDEYDFSGKTVIPFCTHEGSGFGRSIGDLESTLPDATILEGFAVRGSSARNADEDVTQWLSALKLGS